VQSRAHAALPVIVLRVSENRHSMECLFLLSRSPSVTPPGDPSPSNGLACGSNVPSCAHAPACSQAGGPQTYLQRIICLISPNLQFKITDSRSYLCRTHTDEDPLVLPRRAVGPQPGRCKGVRRSGAPCAFIIETGSASGFSPSAHRAKKSYKCSQKTQQTSSG